MSVYSLNTSLTSILKKYSTEERERAKNSIINKVRFDVPRKCGVSQIIKGVLDHGQYVQYDEFISYLKQEQIDDTELKQIISETRQSIHLLKPTFSELVEILLSMNWIEKNDEIIKEYQDFYITLMVAFNNEYASMIISNLIAHWIPKETPDEAKNWLNNAKPNTKLITKRLEIIHKLLERILNVVPMTYDIVLENMKNHFPYYKKSSYIIGGYIHNLLWLLDYKPNFTEHVLQLILEKLVYLDVNAPRNKIEECEEGESDEDDEDPSRSGRIFEMDEEKTDKMSHAVAETLDVCMERLFDYIENFVINGIRHHANFNNDENNEKHTKNKLNNFIDVTKFFEIFLNSFNNVILPSHNTHHVQFLLFYFCSFKVFLVKEFLNNLWKNTTNPNMQATIRKTSIGYIASFLARGKFIPLGMLKNYLSEMCKWAHQYIQRSDYIRSNNSLTANIVFYSVCQAIFYVIAFRSRDLTIDKNGLLFLQSLNLQALVTCNFNPLKVCLPPIATAFAGVTRTYQLAYCHTILERNARRQLATVYSNEIQMPEERLDTFFPFDPYLLKKSGKRISPIYLKYQASEAEEDCSGRGGRDGAQIESQNQIRRKRGDSGANSVGAEDVDDFIIDKRQRLQSESSINDRELQFTYGSSPGFNNYKKE